MWRNVIDCHEADEKKRKRIINYRSDGEIEIVRWNDNSVVIIGSNAYSVEPARTVKGWVKGIRKSNVNQPAVIAAYNQGMGGVDLLNAQLRIV